MTTPTPIEVLKAILKEVDGPGRPLDGNSYLPPSLVFMARDAIEPTASCVVGPTASDWQLVGYFMEDGGRWLKMDNVYADEPDAIPLYRKRTSGTGGNDGR